MPINHMSNAHTGQGRELLGLKLGGIGKIVLGSVWPINFMSQTEPSINIAFAVYYCVAQILELLTF